MSVVLEAAAADVALRQAQRQAKRAALALAVVCLLAALVGAFGAGWHYGGAARSSEALQLSERLGKETQRANDAAGAVQAIKQTLQEERERRTAQQRAAEKVLAERERRIRRLETAANSRRTTILGQVTNDEDCAALRAVPVCRPLADGLWGDAAGDAHRTP